MQWDLLNWALYSEGGQGPMYGAWGACLCWAFLARAVPFAQLLRWYLSCTVLSYCLNVSILILSGVRSCDTRIWHLSYVLERGSSGGTVVAAAISEGAPPMSWQKGDTHGVAMHQNKQHPCKGAAVCNCAHLCLLQSFHRV